MSVATVAVLTPSGPAQFILDLPAGPPSTVLALGHGAGGSVEAVDLLAVRDAARQAGLAVVRITQPYRVAGRRAPAPPHQLDAAWLAVLARVAELPALRAAPLVVGGRSSGARVACRTAAVSGAVGVVALAFPLHPPGRPDRSRAAELPEGLPVLVVNGDRDPFGIPEPAGRVEVVVRPRERHDLGRDPAGSGRVVVDWLHRHGWADLP